MPTTMIPWGHPSAQKKWSGVLANDTRRKSYFSRRFEGKGENNIIEEKTELKGDVGDRVTFDLSVQLRQKPTSGDNRVKGKEEQLRFFNDEVIVDQIRHPVSAGGRMSRKRTAHDLRKVAKNRLSDYWRTYTDEVKIIYLSGARGINAEFIEDFDYTGHAGNPIQAPDSAHHMFAGGGTTKADLTVADTMTRALIERASASISMIRADDPNASEMVPVDIEGSPHFVLLMSEWQAHDLRMESGPNSWGEMQRAMATAVGRASPLFQGGLGMINDVVLHKHANVIRFSDYGVGANVKAARAMLMARQAAVIAYGTPQGMRFMWKEEMEDYDNEPTVVAGTIFGFKKTRYQGRDFGAFSIDTAAKAA